MNERLHKMDKPWFRANNLASAIGSILLTDSNAGLYRTMPLAPGERALGWFVLPPFQRPPVWSVAQKVRFIESIWMRLPLGAYIYNRGAMDSPYDGWLLDGQQRITAILEYAADAFPVMGHLWSELTLVDQRVFRMIPMSCMETNLDDPVMLAEIYDRLAYGGTAHEVKDAVTEVYYEVRRNGDLMEDFTNRDYAVKALGPAEEGWTLHEVTRVDKEIPRGA